MKKQINPMVLVLGRSFSVVSENVQVALVTVSDEKIEATLKVDFKAACEAVKELPEGIKVSAFMKQPFSRKFENGNKALKTAMRHYFPEAAPVVTDDSDAEAVEVVEAIIPVETVEEVVETVEKKKSRKSKKSE